MRRPLLSSVALAGAMLSSACAHGPKGERALARGELQHGGRTRSYGWFRAPRCAAAVPTPAVIALHGRFGDGQGEEALSHLAELAERECFLAIFPDGIDRSWNDARGLGPAAEQGVDDVGFLAALIDRAVAEHGADPTRIALAGMSNGAHMSYTAACTLSERLIGVAAVAGLVPEPLTETGRCAPARPLTVLIFAGTDDPLVPYRGGEVWGDRGRVLSAEASARFWAERSGCRGEPQSALLPDRDPDDGTRVRTTAWRDCAPNVQVVLYSFDGGGHTWPGGWPYLGRWLVGRTSQDLDASEELWRIVFGPAMPTPAAR
jgi:polyhydroxybutyrate depolymerase